MNFAAVHLAPLKITKPFAIIKIITHISTDDDESFRTNQIFKSKNQDVRMLERVQEVLVELWTGLSGLHRTLRQSHYHSYYLLFKLNTVKSRF